MQNNFVYILYAVNAHRNTDRDRHEKYLHSDYRGSFEQYCQFLKNLGEYSFRAYWYTAGYFQTYESACEAAAGNAGDICEAGSYPYAAVVEIPMDCVYPESYLTRDSVTLFQYVREEARYQMLDSDTPFAVFLQSQLTGLMNEDTAGKIEVNP